MQTRENVVLTRDCEATVVPAGNRVIIPEGTEVTITQTLGGSFTVMTDRGFMARVEARDADALGKEPPPESAPPLPDAGTCTPEEVERLVWEQLRTVYDPEIPVNVVDLGLIYDCRVVVNEDGCFIEVDMTMTAPGCGMGDVLKDDAEQKLRALPGVRGARVDIVWEPPWDQSRMSEAARLHLGMDF
jgi:probable FeS assembly SUF system protein SufT